MTPQKLRNKYYLMRHGRSLANEEGIIISDPANGCPGYGLSGAGREQIRNSVENCGFLDSGTLIYCSDFLRTIETAALVAEILKTAKPVPSPLLRERYFGEYEKSGDSNYENVWKKDRLDGHNTHRGVESPEAVRNRFISLIISLEKQFSNKEILLVSHGDILQIALTWTYNAAPQEHRSLDHIETAEIRLFTPPVEQLRSADSHS